MWNSYLKPVPPVIHHDPELPDAWISDIDGTIALMHDRSPFEWDKVDTDAVNTPVVNLLRILSADHTIIITSGRDGSCESLTRKWLKDNQIPYDHLFMRPAGNSEKDAVIKKRIYEEHIQGKFNVKGVFDDRNQVVHLWRNELGLPTFQVADGDF
jgi:hypothetical protein